MVWEARQLPPHLLTEMWDFTQDALLVGQYRHFRAINFGQWGHNGSRGGGEQVKASVSDSAAAVFTARKFSVYIIGPAPEEPTKPGRSCLYGCETALTPGERWECHQRAERTASKITSRFGRRLRLDLAAGFGPFARRIEAEHHKVALAAELRHQGYPGFGGQGRIFTPDFPGYHRPTSVIARQQIPEPARGGGRSVPRG